MIDSKQKMKVMSTFSCSLAVAVVWSCIFFSCLVDRSQAQATDPIEVTAINSIFRRWNIRPANSWNTTGDPCSGAAIIESTNIDDSSYNPGLKCSCSYNNGATCHITHLKILEMNLQGTIPEELDNLKYLVFLKLDQNYLTGPIPAFIGNLSSLDVLSLAVNALSGTIPEELGNLKLLRVLSFGSNNFSGPLPSHLGNIPKLEQIYMASAGVGGEIPSTFQNLVNMLTFWANDNPFTGKIPDFIGNWTKLTDLRLYGNSFEGPIPNSFSNLISLTDLRISDLSNVSSTLDFIKDMKDLTRLVLSNNMISGTIPSNIGDYQKLQILDLSFNNLTGEIPSSLFNLGSLSHLFLGNNSLSGTIPSQKSQSLLYVDLSYNELHGSFPSWVKPDVQVNLVANNFIFDKTNISIFPGLNCLQKNFPCNKGFPRYANFSIKCGGPEMTSPTGVVFERENKTLSPASYYVTDTNKWAVSNVGLFHDRQGGDVYIQNTSAQIANAGNLSSQFFQTARISPGSLRYYGLGLENGVYNINLQFAETGFDNESLRTWQSLGTRSFDIYIQGKLEVKDFDIRKEAGGAYRAVEKDLKANVSENYLEIHLFWAGKGTCAIPLNGYYGSLISAISVTSDFVPTVSGLPPTTTTKKKKTGLIAGITVAAVIASSMLAFTIFFLRKKRLNTNNDEEIQAIGSKATIFSYADVRSATEDFDPKNKLGEGGFGPVYKGTLADGRVVAVKQLSAVSHQGKSQFVTEVATISAVQQRNLVTLYGCCIEGDKRLLVYEYLVNKSLDQALFGKCAIYLDWKTRHEICLGTAKGLAYLHEESRPRIIHRDVKASNILLGADLNPKISDFGLAKLYEDNMTHLSTRVAGTIGYLAPEYALRGHLTEKADVFGFGVVALEILSGRPNSDPSLDEEKLYLLEWAWNLHEKNCDLELVDPKLNEFDEEEARRVIGVALLCTQASPTLRPSMSRVVAMLSRKTEVSAVTSRPAYLTDWQFSEITSSFATSNSSTCIPISTSPNPSIIPFSSPSPPKGAESLLHDIVEQDPKSTNV
ncbi:PREDICTED: probable LRR receptor-like serine/threonine-protein kinase At1g56140 [Nelumbo nucifera]|uniref:non-specific serine/threonine protein kinase n=2 Tax=Nelumbo nucifera TaxID=4432 RepID=A0A1U8BCX0_NELNU|nr:PREDICTED: probable LRR receptor-like serine/threonine-protein kinase At1g56140 [Nelumbo nucifera]DAD43687.1 TPA_asm: hypothetical protein HUJ06_001917 [Nelumbo nucifera]